MTYFHVAPKIWVPRDQPVSGFSPQRVWGDSGRENPEYQVDFNQVSSSFEEVQCIVSLILCPSIFRQIAAILMARRFSAR
jgi:hypothetical protein